MIPQLFFDWSQGILAWMVANLLPVPPAEVFTAIAWITTAGEWLGTHLSKLGILIPFGTASGIITLFLVLLNFFGAILVVRIILWVLNR